jgi:hypothetical protein
VRKRRGSNLASLERVEKASEGRDHRFPTGCRHLLQHLTLLCNKIAPNLAYEAITLVGDADAVHASIGDVDGSQGESMFDEVVDHPGDGARVEKQCPCQLTHSHRTSCLEHLQGMTLGDGHFVTADLLAVPILEGSRQLGEDVVQTLGLVLEVMVHCGSPETCTEQVFSSFDVLFRLTLGETSQVRLRAGHAGGVSPAVALSSTRTVASNMTGADANRGEAIMNSEHQDQGSRSPSKCAEVMAKMTAGGDAKQPCPMSEILARASRTRGFKPLAMTPGLLCVIAGVAIIFEPQVLVWLMATASIVAGIALLAGAPFFSKLAMS